MRGPVVALSAIFLATAISLGGQSAEVVSGSATFASSGQDLTITTSDRAVIRWDNFSVPQGSTMRFVQPGSDSVVVNRVTGSFVSYIDGFLTANGHLRLINPNGIRIGPTGVVRAQSFIATTLANISNEQIFVGKDLDFTGPSTASIVNYGRIEALGGDIHLIARRVVNAGTLSAPRGRVGLAAGNDVLLTQDGELFVRVSVDDTADGGTGVDNTGVIEAVQAQLAGHGNMYALAINTEGVVRATGTTRTADGRIALRSAGGTVRVSGHLAATTVNATGQTEGGQVQIVGRHVEVGPAATIDVSGDTGGGKVHIGGSVKGAGPLANAETTYVSAGAVVSADAESIGDGGEVVVWADGATYFFARVTARGGPAGGDGGFVEVSGKGALVFRGSVDTTAPNGATGLLVLDPTDVVFRPGSGDGGSDGAGVFAGPSRPAGTVRQGDSAPSVIYQSELESLSGATNVRVEATGHVTMDPFGGGNPLTFAAGAGTVAFVADADGSGAGDFTMAGGDRIVTNGRALAISGHDVTVGKVDTGGGKLTLTAGGDLTTGSITAGKVRARTGQAGGPSDSSFGRIRADEVTVRGGAGDDKFTFKGIITSGDFSVFGRGGDDVFKLKDMANVDVAGAFTVSGGGQSGPKGDRLKLSGGSYESVAYTFTGADGKGNDGYIELSAAGEDWVLDFAGLEPIVDNLDVADRVFTLGPDDNEATLADDATAGAMILDGTGFETTVFTNPSDSLTINLAGGDDELTVESVDAGFSGSLSVFGQAGDDTIAAGGLDYAVEFHGGKGDDALLGGRGDDKLWGSRGADSLEGGRGDDKLWGGKGDDYLAGGRGDDKLWGGRGADSLEGGRGDDKLWGGAGDDYLAGGRGDDKLWGGRGTDCLAGGRGDDKLWGGRGDDYLAGGRGDDKLWGGRGDDYLAGGRGDDKLSGGRGDDVLCGGGGDDRMWGGPGDDYLAGGRGDDKLWGGKGDDFLSGWTGDDKLWGGKGDDFLCGWTGDDKLWGGKGDDILCGGPGDDKLWGGPGDDKLCGGRGYDKLFGGRGDDILCRGPGRTWDELCGGPGDDKVIRHPCGFCHRCRRRRPPKGPEPAGRRMAMLPPPVWWDITNRTEEWITASDDGHITPEPGEIRPDGQPVRFWARPMADVLDMMNAHFDSLVRARENMNFYAWR